MALRADGCAFKRDSHGHRGGARRRGLVYASRMAAKVDNTALQDGYQLYHHTFIFTSSGDWAVVQQGMNVDMGWARRYHWLGREVKDFVCEPHAAVCCDRRGRVLNLVASESEEARRASALLSREGPDALLRELKKVKELKLPSHHEVLASDIRPEGIKKVLLKTYEEQPEDFERLLGDTGCWTEDYPGLSSALRTDIRGSLELQGPSQVQLRPRRQGPTPVSCGPEGLRQVYRGPEVGG